MRKQQLELLEKIQKIEKNQFYLMQQPKNPQQKFLHLFAHRHLLTQKMIHKKLDSCLDLLPGSFAQNSLRLGYTMMCVENSIQAPQQGTDLLNLVSSWISYYPGIKSKKKLLLGEVVLQQSLTSDDIQGFDLYLHYLNLISFDLWKLLTGGQTEQEFLRQKPFKEEVEQFRNMTFKHLDASDLLTFLSSCLPKTTLNIILNKASLPAEMRAKFNSYQCLYVNEEIQYYLKVHNRLSILLKSILLILLQIQMPANLLKLLMLISMRYYYVYHHNRDFSAAEIIVYAYNKLTQELRRTLADEFALFIKVILKFGKVKFTTFLSQNSQYLKAIIEGVKKNPQIGYPQESVTPYNNIGIGQRLLIQRGKTLVRYFEVLQECSIFYYRLIVESLDINVKLWYLGEIGSKQESKTLLFNQEKKSGSIKNCINATRKGIYMFEFDNSYSWINNKVIRFENVIYAPLQIKTVNTDQWIADFYGNIYQNQIADMENIYLVKNMKLSQPKSTAQNQAALSKGNDTFTLLITSPSASYQYQTDNASRMESKIKQIRSSHAELHFTIDGMVTKDQQEISAYLYENNKIHLLSKNQKPTEKIDFYEEQQQEEKQESDSKQDQDQEIVQKQVEQSTILHEEKPATEEVVEQQKQIKPHNSISYTQEEGTDFYDE